MIYEISWNYRDLIYIAFLVIAAVIFFIFKMIKNKSNGNNMQTLLIKLCLLFAISICGLSSVYGISRKIYGMYMYHSENYETIEGEIKNLEFIYENNTDNIKGIKFNVNEVNFKINEEMMNLGYSYINDKKIKNNDCLKIYYIRQNGNESETILRIDDIS